MKNFEIISSDELKKLLVVELIICSIIGVMM